MKKSLLIGLILSLFSFTPSVYAGMPGCDVVSGINYTAADVIEIDITGLESCVKYDQQKVTGTVSLGSATVNLIITGFTPSIGNSFRLVDNDGTDAVIGTYSALPELSTFSSGGVTYRISYKGGDGNDVVLSVVSAQSSQPGTTNNSTPQTPDSGLEPAQTASLLIVLLPVIAVYSLKRLHGAR